MDWAQEEFKTAKLQDTRLNARAAKLAQRLAAQPGQSIPNACRGWAETQAAYRFLSNKRTGWDDLMQAHWDASIERMKSCCTFRTRPNWISTGVKARDLGR